MPVYAHRFLPAGPGSGHPVLSVHQTDVIVYGADLVAYVYQEFGAGDGLARDDPARRPRVTVRFWRDLL